MLSVLLLSLQVVGAPPVHGIEVAFGADNIAATTGNGGLTVAISPDGDLTVLSWPSPTYFDHVHHLAKNGFGARDLPRMGALEGMGAFAGIAWRGADGLLTVTWLRDWTREVRYSEKDTSVPLATFRHDDLDLTVTQTDLVPADVDALVRHLRVERGPASPVAEAYVIGYANLSPNVSKMPELPVADFLLDHKNDFLAVWHPDAQAILHFHPGDTGVAHTVWDVFAIQNRDFGLLGALLAAAPLDVEAVDEAARDLDAHYASGVVIALGASPAADQFQIGADTTDTCTALAEWADTVAELSTLFDEFALALPDAALELVRCADFDPLATPTGQEGWTWVPQDALADAGDGELSDSPLAGAQVNTALRIPLSFEGDVATATLHFAAGATAADSMNTLSKARALDPDALQSALEADDRAFLATLNLPSGASDALIALSKRTFLSLRSGIDRESKALVASISRQPPYHLDWPRDGVFFNVALDLAGLTDLVTERLDFYADVVRKEDAMPLPLLDGELPGWPDCDKCRDYPAHSWEMNYYSDGVTGGNIRLEIDNTALLVWGYAAHAGFLPGDERDEWMARVWPTVRSATDFLASWRDPKTGLNWPANEDDNFAFTQGLQSAVTVYAALAGASMIARALGHEDAWTRWEARANELSDATFEHLWTEEDGFLSVPASDDPDVEVRPNRGGPVAWLGWPARMVEWTDERLHAPFREALPQHVAVAQGEGEGASYLTKLAISAALVFGPDSEEGKQALAIAEAMASEVADPHTLHLGEVFLNLDTDGDGQTDTRQGAVAPPHLWAMTLVYLTAMAVHEPEAFDPHLDVLPLPDLPGYREPEPSPEPDPSPDLADDAVPPPGAAESSGCSSTSRPSTASWPLRSAVPGLLLLLGLGFVRRFPPTTSRRSGSSSR